MAHEHLSGPHPCRPGTPALPPEGPCPNGTLMPAPPALKIGHHGHRQLQWNWAGSSRCAPQGPEGSPAHPEARTNRWDGTCYRHEETGMVNNISQYLSRKEEVLNSLFRRVPLSNGSRCHHAGCSLHPCPALRASSETHPAHTNRLHRSIPPTPPAEGVPLFIPSSDAFVRRDWTSMRRSVSRTPERLTVLSNAAPNPTTMCSMCGWSRLRIALQGPAQGRGPIGEPLSRCSPGAGPAYSVTCRPLIRVPPSMMLIPSHAIMSPSPSSR